MTESKARAEQVALFPVGPLPNIQKSGLPPYNVTGVLRQRNMAQMKEWIKTPEKELSDQEIDNLSDAEFKTLVIRMLTAMIEYSHRIEEEVKAMQSEIKKENTGNQE